MNGTRLPASSVAANITAAATASFESCPDARLRQIMQALVRHLHAFASEVQVTEDEWARAIQILTQTGHITDERRQEFILWSDVLGLSMLVDALAHPSANGATESTVLGPFWTPNAPKRGYAESTAEDAAGTPALVRGRVLDQDGRAIAGAELDIWQNGDNRLYAVQDAEAPEAHLRGRFYSREDGTYAFVGVRPVPYTIPHDGPVGLMLDAALNLPVATVLYRRLASELTEAAALKSYVPGR